MAARYGVCLSMILGIMGWLMLGSAAAQDVSSTPVSPAPLLLAAYQQHDDEALKRLQQMSPAEVAALDKKLAAALTYYYDRNFARALPIFREIAARVETMDVMFWLGRSALGAGETDLAVSTFERMLAIDPSLQRVRLELALAYMQSGRDDAARRELELVQRSSPPPAVQANIQRLLDAIEARQRRMTANLRLSQGILWDDNASSGPDQRELQVVGGTLTLDSESTKVADEAAVTEFHGSFLYDIGERRGLMWNTSGSVSSRVYFDYGKFNYLLADVSTAGWWVGAGDILKLPLGYTRRYYGSDRLSRTLHLDPSWEHFFARRYSISAAFTYEAERFDDPVNFVLDHDSRKIEIGPNLYLRERRLLVAASLGYHDHDADARRFSYWAPVVAARLLLRLPTATEMFVGYQWTDRHYRDEPIFYGHRRRDRRHTIRFVCSQDISSIFFVSTALSFEDNNSNAGLYTFDRTTFSLSLGCKL